MSELEVQHLIADVAESFGVGVDEWLDYFADPLVVAAPASTMTLEHAAARSVFEEFRSQLRDRGLNRTEVRSVNIMMLGDDIAFADVNFDRLRSDDSLHEPLQAGYLCRKRNGRWLVVTLAPRSAVTPSVDD